MLLWCSGKAFSFLKRGAGNEVGKSCLQIYYWHQEKRTFQKCSEAKTFSIPFYQKSFSMRLQPVDVRGPPVTQRQFSYSNSFWKNTR